MRNNEEVVMIAVQKYPNALRYASIELRNNKSIVMAALKNNGETIRFASK